MSPLNGEPVSITSQVSTHGVRDPRLHDIIVSVAASPWLSTGIQSSNRFF